MLKEWGVEQEWRYWWCFQNLRVGRRVDGIAKVIWRVFFWDGLGEVDKSVRDEQFRRAFCSREAKEGRSVI